MSPPAVVDRISELCDDVLLHILRFLPSARNAARTSVLSRRWRHLWSIAPRLRFDIGDGVEVRGDARRLVAAIDATLARRACEGAAVDVLEISFVYVPPPLSWQLYRHPGPAASVLSSHSRAAAWLRFAELHVARSLAVDLPTSGRPQDVVAVAGDPARLPLSARLEMVRLHLGRLALTLPAAAPGAYRALADFQLHNARLAADDADVLGDLLSASCSPRLRRLSLQYVDGLVELRLHAAATLEELELVELADLESLDVDAPGLRRLHVDIYGHPPLDDAAARISAPALEVLECCNHLPRPPRLQFVGAAAVRHVSELTFFYPEDALEINETTVWFLKNCSAMDHLELELVVHMPVEGMEWPIGDLMNDITELPNVTNLELTVDLMSGGHAIGATLAKLISRCKKLQHLSIDIDINDDYDEEEYEGMEYCSDSSCFCRQPMGWEDKAISLEHLTVAAICGSASVGDLAKLVHLLVANSPALVTVKDERGTHSYGGVRRRTSAQENEEEGQDNGRERKRRKTMDGI